MKAMSNEENTFAACPGFPRMVSELEKYRAGRQPGQVYSQARIDIDSKIVRTRGEPGLWVHQPEHPPHSDEPGRRVLTWLRYPEPDGYYSRWAYVEQRGDETVLHAGRGFDGESFDMPVEVARWLLDNIPEGVS